MTETNLGKTKRRGTPVTIALSFIMPGLGHVYCGRIAKGVILALFSCVLIPIMFGLLSVSSSSVRMTIVVASMIAFSAIWLYALIDSWYTARHTRNDYRLKDYNRWYVYLTLILMGTCSSMAIVLHTRAKAVEAFRVPAASDYPTIVPNDRFLANKLAYKTADPKRGDLVVHICPDNRQWRYVKRVVAVAGDTVEIKDVQLYINNQKVQRQKLAQTTLDKIRIRVKGEPLEGDVFEEINGDARYKIFLAKPPHDKSSGDFIKITVPEHHCFVMGDNRNLSRDSRHYGPVPLATIIGRADYLYWPAKDWSRFGRLAN